eukprot:4293296-Amphidinium_carterae.1
MHLSIPNQTINNYATFRLLGAFDRSYFAQERTTCVIRLRMTVSAKESEAESEQILLACEQSWLCSRGKGTLLFNPKF